MGDTVTRVKYFQEENSHDLADSINNFVKKYDLKIINISYIMYYTVCKAMVIYEVESERADTIR